MATLAVIVSFLPMFFITGMMGPYMAADGAERAVAMLMSMLVAFTITPWLAYQVLPRSSSSGAGTHGHGHGRADDIEAIRQTFLYRLFRPLMAPLLSSRRAAVGFLLVIVLLPSPRPAWRPCGACR